MKNINKKIINILILLMLLNPYLILNAADINTGTIVSKTLAAAPACLKYKVVGVCFWLVCGFGCSIKTTAKVGHYMPELVVSSYNTTGENPWVEIRTSLGSAQVSVGNSIISSLTGVFVGSGNNTEGAGDSEEHKSLRFKEVDGIGHPLARTSIGGGYICKAKAQPFRPYYQSTVDLLSWRFEVPESLYPAAYIPGMREIGNFPINTWGSVYPRTGHVTQSEDPKAGAVTAQRVGDIVTRSGQPHLYISVTGCNGYGCKAPPALVEGDEDTGTWQMLTPKAETSCSVFGTNDVFSISSWADNKNIDDTGDYAWNLWRPYECCVPGPGLFIGSIP